MGPTKKSRYHRQRSPTPSTDTESDREHRRKSRHNSRNTAESLDRFTEAITSALERSNTRQHSIGFKGDAVPIFDPEDRNQSSELWCKKVDELKKVFMWTEEATIYFALSKLRGLSQVWYKGLASLNYTWTEWKEKLQDAFPANRDFYETLMEMIKRRKRTDESYAKYYYEKLGLLNACQINGENAVSCIIGGLDDRIVKTGAKAGRYKTPGELFQYLSQLNDVASSAYQPHRSKVPFKRNDADRRFKKQQSTSTSNPTCFKCGKQGHFANKCYSKGNFDNRCNTCRSHHHSESNCPRKGKIDQNKTVALLETATTDVTNTKYYKDVKINDIKSKAYIDFGSSCTIITWSEAQRLELNILTEDKVTLHGYGKGLTVSKGSVIIKIEIDNIAASIKAIVVSDKEQNVPIIVGRTFTELPQIVVIKSDETLRFLKRDVDENLLLPDLDPTITKIVLRSSDTFVIPPQHQGIIKLQCDHYSGTLYVEASLRPEEGRESCIPRTILCIDNKNDNIASMPFINLSDQDIFIKKNEVVARAWPCEEESRSPESVCRIEMDKETELCFDKVNVGQINEEEKGKLFELLREFRDCIALNISEIGCAKSAKMKIQLQEDKPFSFRPYRMARIEEEVVNGIVNDLLENHIIRESDGNYASPVVLVKKKNGEARLCIDYRKLNSLTIKDSHPLPRIDDQIDRLRGGIYFTSLDLRSGYHQIPMEEESKRYTAFVTPSGQYEFERMPFGLTNAPRKFQRYMNKILRPIQDIAAVYLDDVLLHAQTVPDALTGLQKTLQIFRDEGLTLNLNKCSFLMTTISFLGFEVSNGCVKPGREKIKAVDDFPAPRTVHQVRQFLGLTGYFRHFVRNYAIIARPLTQLIRKTTEWTWNETEKKAFEQLKNILIKRPVLALFDPEGVTEVHTDASAVGLAGILLQYQENGRLQPVAYYSRQTRGTESKFHSYELETLAVVESLKKFRSYLLGIKFTVITDCNSLKTTSEKKQLIPRIARWWLQLQEFTFDVKYRPGDRMKHVDALSRNPLNEHFTENVLHITQADWVLAGQLTDEKIKEIHKVLSQPPQTEYEKNIYKNYALRDGRVYRITARGIQWVVPHGMRNQVVRAAHDDLGHFSVEKTLYRLCEHYWFPRMKEYVEKYISTCIRCLYNKRKSGKKEGYLHPIPKDPEPMKTVHIDHLGPFPKSKRGNTYIIAMIDAFTKFLFIRAVKTTNTKGVIEFCKDVFSVYGAPKVIISDQGSSFTSKAFMRFCEQNGIKHVKNAVATPRANGQVERLNRSILSALMTSTLEEELWDENVRQTQFSINSMINKSTGKTPSELLFGFKPRGGTDVLLSDEISKTTKMIEDLVVERNLAGEKIKHAQEKQKEHFDKKRKKPKIYREGDLVLIEKTELAPNTSRKLLSPYGGPFVVKKVLPNDRYVVQDMQGTHRKLKKGSYERVVAVDRMKPWSNPGGISDETASESGEDGVVLSTDETDDDQLGTSSLQDGRM